MNSKIEQISESCQPNLLNMPIKVMGEVLKNLDCPSIFRLRKVCRNLRSLIDEINPELHFESVTLKLPLTTSSLESYFKDMREDFKNEYMKFYGPRTGCRLTWIQENAYKYPEITMEDAETLLKHPRLILKNLTIDLFFSIDFTSEYIEKKEEDLNKFYEHIKSLLRNRNQHLRIKEIQLDVHHLSQAAEFLKCTDPHSLKTISIFSHSSELIEMDFSELEVLEQWNNAEGLRINGNYILTPVESFSTFKTIFIQCKKISMEKLNEVREFFARSSKLQNLAIVSGDIRSMKNQILSNFGQFDSYNGDPEIEDEFDDALFYRRNSKMSTWTWLKDIPGSIEKLQIVLDIGLLAVIKFTTI